VRKMLVGWNFADELGQPVPFSPENIDNLDVSTYVTIAQLTAERISPEKKN